MRFSYLADHELTGQFEEQASIMVRDYRGDGE